MLTSRLYLQSLCYEGGAVPAAVIIILFRILLTFTILVPRMLNSLQEAHSLCETTILPREQASAIEVH